MSKGIWTKCISSVDPMKSYYYNASLDRSVWNPPKDGIIHEAVHLEVNTSSVTDAQPSSEPGEISNNQSTSDQEQLDQMADDILSSAGITTSQLSIESNSTTAIAAPQIPIDNSRPIPPIIVPPVIVTTSEVQERIQQALNNKKAATLAQASTSNKRFRTEKDNSDLTEYEKQKLHFENSSGVNPDAPVKWLAR